jgi:peptidoglycan/LPS O-acetylase OafA/YrhL
MSSSSIERRQPAYRADIDGLRAISVIAVILFHFTVPGFRGGYVGVDVFFVISGYLITQLLVLRSALPFGRWLADFYVRRARRILPALLLMLTVSAAVATWLFGPIEFRAFGKSLALSTAMLGNYAAATFGDYFGATQDVAPLTHLWSIAVEEQFYLAYPLVLFLILRFAPRRAQSALLVSAVLASFALCVWASSAHANFNYYLPITRAWELGTGALLGLRVLEWSPSRGVRELLAVMALAAIIVPVFYYNSSTPFPGWYALPPCLGAAALIATGGSGGSAVNRMLALRPVVFIGLISYALYLWHLPLIVFRDYYMVTPRGTLEIVALLVVLAVMAIASWKWFEVPVRKRLLLPSNRTFLVTTGVVVSGLLALGARVWFSDGLLQRFGPEERRIYSVLTVPLGNLDSHCQQAVNDQQLCHFGTADSPDNVAVLWGDSHALALLPAVQAVAARNGAQLQFAFAAVCSPLVELRPRKTGSPWRLACQDFNFRMMRAVERIRPRTVILAAFWGDWEYYSATGLEGPARPLDPSFGERLEETLRRIGADGRRICIVRDVPIFRYRVPQVLAMAHRRGIDPDVIDALTLEAARRQQHPFDVEFDRLQKLGSIVSVTPRETLCASGTCRMRDDAANVLYRDANHLTPAGAQYVEPLVQQCFTRPSPPTTLSDRDSATVFVRPRGVNLLLRGDELQ